VLSRLLERQFEAVAFAEVHAQAPRRTDGGDVVDHRDDARHDDEDREQEPDLATLNDRKHEISPAQLRPRWNPRRRIVVLRAVMRRRV